jgi:hypothetical protein
MGLHGNREKKPGPQRSEDRERTSYDQRIDDLAAGKQEKRFIADQPRQLILGYHAENGHPAFCGEKGTRQ